MEVIVDFIDENRESSGSSPSARNCRWLRAPITPRSPGPLGPGCPRRLLGPVLWAIWQANYRVYGVRKLWRAAQRAGHDLGRDQVAR